MPCLPAEQDGQSDNSSNKCAYHILQSILIGGLDNLEAMLHQAVVNIDKMIKEHVDETVQLALENLSDLGRTTVLGVTYMYCCQPLCN